MHYHARRLHNGTNRVLQRSQSKLSRQVGATNPQLISCVSSKWASIKPSDSILRHLHSSKICEHRNHMGIGGKSFERAPIGPAHAIVEAQHYFWYALSAPKTIQC